MTQNFNNVIEDAMTKKAEILSEFSRDTLCRRVMEIDGRRRSRPIHALIDRAVTGTLLLSHPDSFQIKGGGCDTPGWDKTLMQDALLIREAEVFLWKDDMISMALNGKMPSHTIGRNQLPFPIMFFVPEVPLRSGEFHLASLLVYEYTNPGKDRSGIFICQICFNDEKQTVYAEHFLIEYGTRFPDGLPEGEAKGVEWILSMLSFLNSPYTEAPKERMARADRRRLAATDQSIPEVHVVQLRARKGESSPPETNGSIDYQHQWMVRGHHRAQWYSSTQTHKVIWIAPHMKGPEDKPVLQKVYAVAR